ncbi:MAG: DUF6624 domain-containing protein [Planctomycetota bacterium]
MLKQATCLLALGWVPLAMGEQAAAPVGAEAAPTSSDPTMPELRDELLRRRDVDQKARHDHTDWEKANGGPTEVDFEGKSPEEINALAAEAAKRLPPEAKRLGERLAEVDAENTRWMKGVIADHGWPTPKLVGKDGAAAAWLLVQHADADRKFQRRCLDLMMALPADQVSRQNVAYLTDRVLLAEGEKQRYGTQFFPYHGKLLLRPVEERETLDQRRREMGLPPVAEYLRMAEKFYGIGKVKADAKPE